MSRLGAKALAAVMLAAGGLVAGCSSVTFSEDPGPPPGERASFAPTGTSRPTEGEASGTQTERASSETEEPADGASEEETSQQYYEVRRGDTLIAIATRFGVDLNALSRANNIADPTRIFVGQILVIPPPPDESEEPLLTIAPPTNPVLPSVLPTVAPSTTALWER